MPVLSEERPTVTVQELRHIVEPASDLITSRYHYTDADKVNSAKQFLGRDVPLTRNVAVFTYSGVIGVGFDINDVTFEVTDGDEGERGTITVALPELKVVQNEIEMESFTFVHQTYSLFNQEGMDFFTSILGQLKQNAMERALADEGFMTGAQTSAETTIRNFLEASHVGDYYTISIVSSDAQQEEA